MTSQLNQSRRSTLQFLAVAPIPLSFIGTPCQAAAADFPDRPVKLMNPYSTGGSTDQIARWLSDRMAPLLGQPLILEAKAGQSGSVAAAFVAKGPKDGYTLCLGTSSSLGFAKLLNNDLPYDPLRDFIHVAKIGSVPVSIFTSADSGFNSVQDLVEAAKSRPGKFSYGSTGALGTTHLAGEMFCQRAGISMVHIPYTGNGALYFTDLIGGRTQAVFAGVSGGLALAKAGKIKLIAITAAERSQNLPDVPTVSETYPGFEVPAWFSFAVAAGTPEPIVRKLESATLAALRDPAARTVFSNAGVDLDPIIGGREFGSKVAAELRMWERLLKQAGMIK